VLTKTGKITSVEKNMHQISRLEALYRRHGDEVVRLAYFLTGDKETAAEVLQEAFLRFARRPLLPRDPDHARRYLFRTTINLSRGHGRCRKREIQLTERAAQELANRPLEQTHRDTRIWVALLGLPPRQRTAVYLRYYEDLSEAQAADLMACSVSALKSLVNRGLATLRATTQGAADE
jgi:RNA polymerase sigma factor (sigma-70 family)